VIETAILISCCIVLDKSSKKETIPACGLNENVWGTTVR
jgi:hypothetical protein